VIVIPADIAIIEQAADVIWKQAVELATKGQHQIAAERRELAERVRLVVKRMEGK
jgi:hypothetical protein